ncbi:hypothetical protein BGX31_005110 [Mortierella sp. GBA43]|nr:hypothetical protein BGX31_005110 [Mortierella sp. GBA43]
MTPSLEPPSGASSPTKSYFRSPWKGYYQGIPKVRGPGSDAGSVSASESGRGASSVIKEPIARLSAGIKATVFSAGNSLESGYTSETGSLSGVNSSKSKTKARYRISADHSAPRRSSVDGKRQQQQQLDDQLFSGRLSKEWSSAANTPPPSLSSTRDKFLLTVSDADEGGKDSRMSSPGASTPTRNQKPSSHMDMDNYARLPPFVLKSKEDSLPILLDTYFTLHDQVNDQVIYSSETVTGSNDPSYNPIEDHLFTDLTKRRSSHVIVRIWAGHRGSDFYLLLEWRVDLCCLRYIGKELRDLPTSLPNNTILFGFENGFYTAPDDDDMADHPHTSLPEPISTAPGTAVGVVASYTYDAVMRLNNLHECIADTKQSRDDIKHDIETALNKENAPMIMHKRRGEHNERLWHLQGQVGNELKALEADRKKAAKLRRELDRRREGLAESQERGQTQVMYLEENMIKLAQNKESLYHALQEYSTKRTELIATLFTIFPITESERDPNLLKICNVALPNSVYNGMDEDTISVALGYACNLVVMLAHYLSVPLRYPLTPMGSRAYVLDPVSRLVGPKEFPLFGKGQDSQRFEYGVFLLNKNVEQLLNSQGLQFMDLRQTLPNLRYLMETLLTTSPSQSMLIRSKLFSRKKHILYDHERLSNLVVIPIEQRGRDHIHPSGMESSSGCDSCEHEKPESGSGSGSGKRLHERNPSVSKSNASERSPLVREYDPVEGDYMLILDNASTKTSRSRNETSGSDISTVKRVASRNVNSSRVGHSHHNKTISATRRVYGTSTTSSETEGNNNDGDDEDRQSVDDPAFRDWASEAVGHRPDTTSSSSNNHFGETVSEKSTTGLNPRSLGQYHKSSSDSGSSSDHLSNLARRASGAGEHHGHGKVCFESDSNNNPPPLPPRARPSTVFELTKAGDDEDSTSQVEMESDSGTGTDDEYESDHPPVHRRLSSATPLAGDESSKELMEPRRVSRDLQKLRASAKQRIRRLSDKLGASHREDDSTRGSKELMDRHKQSAATATSG